MQTHGVEPQSLVHVAYDINIFCFIGRTIRRESDMELVHHIHTDVVVWLRLFSVYDILHDYTML